MADSRRCIGVNRDGTPCSAGALPDRDWCLWHDPQRAEQRKAWSAAGGRAKSNQARARRRVLTGARGLDEVDAALCAALDDLLAGKLEPGVASAAATLARAIVATRQAGEVEQRLNELEAMIKPIRRIS